MTQAAFAESIGISQGSLSDIESDRSMPSVTTLISVLTVYNNVGCEWLLGIGDRNDRTGLINVTNVEKDKVVRKVKKILSSGNKEAVGIIESVTLKLSKMLENR